MPVTIQVAKHEARPVPAKPRVNIADGGRSENVLKRLAFKDVDTIGPILQTRLGQQTSLPDGRLQDLELHVQDHGLVRAAWYAYSQHHHLVLRPEDIWFAILTQFSFYVNAHAEELRSSFVAHKGKKGLILRDPGQPDMGLMCRNMTKLIDENIVDPKLREWILPAFTTTTINDEVVAAVIMMGTLQRYFDYVFDCSCCGIPSVTLLGELSDWEEIQRRLEKLAEYGSEPTHFRNMLRPVLKYMVASFTAGPEDSSVVNFWSRMIDRNCGSGLDDLTGWATVFCFWDEEGKCLADSILKYPSCYPPDPELGVAFHYVGFNMVPAGFVSAPVTYISPESVVISTKLLAGFVGYEATVGPNYPYEAPKIAEDSEDDTLSGGKGTPPQNKKGLVSAAKSLLSCTGKLFSKSRQDGPSSEPAVEKAKHNRQVSTEAQTPKKTDNKQKSPGRELDALQPVTGWWMYEVKGGEDTGMHRKDFFQNKMANDWNGQASTGYVQADGKTVVVNEGLPEE